MQMRTGNSLVLVYRTGTYVIRGGKSIEDTEEARDHLLSILADLGVIDDTDDSNFAIQNVVYVGNLDQDIDIHEMVIQFGFEKTEYKPEQFPGLVYRPEDTNCVFLIFASGKLSSLAVVAKGMPGWLLNLFKPNSKPSHALTAVTSAESVKMTYRRS